jgi:hypothetical protein
MAFCDTLSETASLRSTERGAVLPVDPVVLSDNDRPCLPCRPVKGVRIQSGFTE